MRKTFAILALLITSVTYGQNLYPTHWWTGMNNRNLQIIVHHPGIGNATSVKATYPGVSVKKFSCPENKNYLFVDIEIGAAARPGTIKFNLGGNSPVKQLSYELKKRNPGNGTTRNLGVTQADFVYLLMPDRFANGDPSNDAFANMRDTVRNRNNPFARHGGDLKGIQNHLDYLKELGVTAIWPTSVVENDMNMTGEGGTTRSTYHGYAFTDQYNVDRRFGGNKAYKELVDATHAKGMKFMQDAVYNHIGNDHWSFLDLPMKDWINQWPTYTNTSYKDQPIVDPYASNFDKKLSVDGWFTRFLVDLNQRNPYVSNFLIQYAIWATEEFGIDGWRVDTYFYSDEPFLNKVNTALLKEFPRLTIFGEAWVQSVVNSAYFAENNLNIPFKHNCQGVTDFPVLFAMIEGLTKDFGWNDGVSKLYSTLAQDIAYKDPTRNCIFLDNHDLDRIYSVIGEDYSKYKMGINWLLTLRGIPQLYYGTETLMKNFKNPTDAEVRHDFPGGWPGDKTDKFTAAGRTEQEQAAFTHVSVLANFRKNSSALTTGRLMQYVPNDGVYAYFRYSPTQTVMVISNTGKNNYTPDMRRFAERTTGFTKARDIHTGKTVLLTEVKLAPKESAVYELLK